MHSKTSASRRRAARKAKEAQIAGPAPGAKPVFEFGLTPISRKPKAKTMAPPKAASAKPSTPSRAASTKAMMKPSASPSKAGAIGSKPSQGTIRAGHGGSPSMKSRIAHTLGGAAAGAAAVSAYRASKARASSSPKPPPVQNIPATPKPSTKGAPSPPPATPKPTSGVPKKPSVKYLGPKPAVSKPVEKPAPPTKGKAKSLGTSSAPKATGGAAKTLGTRESYAAKGKGVVSPLPSESPKKPSVKYLERPPTSKAKSTAPAPKAPSAAKSLESQSKSATSQAKEITKPSSVQGAAKSLQQQLEEARAENQRLKSKPAGVPKPKDASKKPSAPTDKVTEAASKPPESNRPPLRKGAGKAKRLGRAARAMAEGKPPTPEIAKEYKTLERQFQKEVNRWDKNFAKAAEEVQRGNKAPEGQGGKSVAPKPSGTVAKPESKVTKAAEVVQRRIPKASKPSTVKVKPVTEGKAIQKPTSTKVKPPKTPAPTTVKPKPSTPKSISEGSPVSQHEAKKAADRKAMIEKHMRQKGATVEDPKKPGETKKIAGSTVQKRFAQARRAGRPGLGTRAATTFGEAQARGFTREFSRAAKALGKGLAPKVLAPLQVLQGAGDLRRAFEEQKRARRRYLGGGRA